MAPDHKITSPFKSFIIEILNIARLTDRTIVSLTDNESMTVFRKAFTHKSYDQDFNYEFLEFRGDVIVNYAIVSYIRERFPRVTSIKWITKLKHNLASKKNLSNLAEKGRFLDHIHYGQEMYSVVSDRNRNENEKYQSMMEDTFEAFTAAIVQVVDSKFRHGVGYAVAYAILSAYFNLQEISLKQSDVFDSKTRLKEIYDIYAWVIGKNIKTKYDDRRGFVTTIYGYPINDMKPEEKNKRQIGYGYGATQQLAQEFASRKALHTLKYEYKIEENIPSPYIEFEEREIQVEIPEIPDGFHDFVLSFLVRGRIKGGSISDFLDEESLTEYRLSLVDKTFDIFVNQNLYKFTGISVVDLILPEYLGNRFPHLTSEKWLTNIKHNIVSHGLFSKFVMSSGFEEYIIYGPDMQERIDRRPELETNSEYLKMMEGCLKAFLGAIVHVVDSKRRRGVGYSVAYNILSSFLDTIDISTDYKDVFDNKTRLKELYDRNKWNLGKSILDKFDENTGIHKAFIFGYPKGDRSQNEHNKVMLGVGEARTKKEAQQRAAEIALDILEKSYRLFSIPK